MSVCAQRSTPLRPASPRMAQGNQQIDTKVLQQLLQKFPEVPEGVVSQCVVQVGACFKKIKEKLKHLIPSFVFLSFSYFFLRIRTI